MTAVAYAAAVRSEGRGAPPIKPALLNREARRLQRPRKRLPGQSSLPVGARYVGRGSSFANPFLAIRFGHARSVNLHRQWLRGELSQRKLVRLGFGYTEINALIGLRLRTLGNLHVLVGQDIQCWCPVTSRFCHGDTLKALAAELAAELKASL